MHLSLGAIVNGQVVAMSNSLLVQYMMRNCVENWREKFTKSANCASLDTALPMVQQYKYHTGANCANGVIVQILLVVQRVHIVMLVQIVESNWQVISNGRCCSPR